MLLIVELEVIYFFFFQAEDGIRDIGVTGVQTCALPISSAERVSEHPLGEAIVRGAKDLCLPLADVDEFEAVSGGGISARVEGRGVLVGSHRFLSEAGVPEDGLVPKGEELAREGKTPVFVAVDGESAGIVAVADTVR